MKFFNRISQLISDILNLFVQPNDRQAIIPQNEQNIFFQKIIAKTKSLYLSGGNKRHTYYSYNFSILLLFELKLYHRYILVYLTYLKGEGT